MKPHAAQVSNVFAREFLVTDGSGKFLLMAVFFNIPVWGFIPYVTQAITIIMLSFFLKHTIINEQRQHKAITARQVRYRMKSYGVALIIGTMFLQLVWIPFVLQFLTLIALGILYATMTKYEQLRDAHPEIRS